MLIHHFLEMSADRAPEKGAVWCKGEWKTYGDLEARANRLAWRLQDAGVRRGDRVALLQENSTEYVISHMAVFKAGAVNVSLNTDTTPDTLAYLLNDCEAKVLIAGQKHLRHVAGIKEMPAALKHVAVDGSLPPGFGGPFEVTSLQEVWKEGPDSRPPCSAIDIDLASIFYTSGSTGKPKGVMLSHLNLVSNTRSTVSYLNLKETDRIMVVLPFHYIYGTSLLYTHLSAGASVVIENRFLYPNVVLDAMEQQSVTGFAGVPSTFMLLLNKSTLRSRKFASLRFVTQAGGGMAPSIQKQVHEAFAPAQVFIMYGATEAAPRLTYLDPHDLPRKWGSIGKPVPNVEVYPADQYGRKVPAGAVGEIVARGSNIMMGYWKDAAATDEVLRYGLYFTGDLGKEDAEGFLYIEGRVKDIIKVGGNRVGAREIEEKILDLEGVADVAVIGVEDPILGEAIKAFVVPKENHTLSEADLKGRLQASLPPYKLPKWVVFRSELPKTEAGKILKIKLKEEDAAAGG